jgi:hypothetical protein
MTIHDDVEARSNVEIIARSRGKIVDRYEGHNVFLNYGRQWLIELMSYDTTGWPDTKIPVSPTTADRRIRYIGFGIGGNQQTATIPANVATTYPGTNTQTDTDKTITELERPILVTTTWGATYEWEQELDHASTTWTTGPYKLHVEASFTEYELSLAGAPGPFSYVPLAEIGLYENACDPADDYTTERYAGSPVRPNPVCYHTFPSLSKTDLITIDVRWDIRLP